MTNNKRNMATQLQGLLKPTTPRATVLPKAVGDEDAAPYGAPNMEPVQVTLYMPPALLLRVDELLFDLKRTGVNMKRAEVVRAALGALVDSKLDLAAIRNESDLNTLLTEKLKS